MKLIKAKKSKQKSFAFYSRPLSSSQTTTTPQNPSQTLKSINLKSCESRTATPNKGGGNPGTQKHAQQTHLKTLTIVFHTSNHTQTERAQKLRRKEVIQPHLPVRLPCYDLVPITSLTLDGSIPKGLGHRLRVLPTFMT